MDGFLELVRTIWPIAVVLCPLVLSAGFLWLRTQFPSKADLAGTEKRIEARIAAHEERLKLGSDKLADLDKRVALVEDDCDSSPNRNELNQSLAVLAGRMSGVESSVRSLERSHSTTNDYLHTLIQAGIAAGGKP